MKHLALPLLSALSLGLMSGRAQTEAPVSPAIASLDLWKGNTPPFAFKYDGKDSNQFFASWPKTEEPVTPSEGGETHHYVYTDPATKLKITADVRTFTDFDAIDWVLHFTNGGATDTPILEDIHPLAWSLAADGPDPILHCAEGSHDSLSDFMPRDTPLPPGATADIGCDQGRSSDGYVRMTNVGSFPFFNLQAGDHGVIGAIGWTGSWITRFDHDKVTKTVAMNGGMIKTHLLLHPGETICTPRILLMNWKGGDIVDSQNLWRRLLLAHYSPRDLSGHTVTEPVCFGSWGNEPIATKLAAVHFIHDKKIPADLYWIDAGWYGDKTLNWERTRGNWACSPILYPDGFKPLGDLLKSYHIGLLVWLEAETAMKGSTFLTQHPDWYIAPSGDQPYLLNLGNPDALKGMTDFVSKFITDSGITWYRQDFNFSPVAYWASADKPDRICITEIKDIEGLYAYWDALRAQHPGLQIDNCASGGRRIDLEMITRSVALHRSDRAGIPLGEQVHTQGLAPWVPLNDGILGVPVTDPSSSLQLYQARCGYSAGINFSIEPKNFSNDAMIDASRANLEEFRELRPYAIGDFYPLISYSLDNNVWTAFQWHRSDLKSGVLVFLRRPESPYPSVNVNLRAIDPHAQYEVETRSSLAKGPVQQMSGKELMHFKITIPDQPGSALVFYKQQ